MDFDWGSGIDSGSSWDWNGDQPTWAATDYQTPDLSSNMSGGGSWGGWEAPSAPAPASASPGWANYRQGEYNPPAYNPAPVNYPGFGASGPQAGWNVSPNAAAAQSHFGGPLNRMNAEEWGMMAKEIGGSSAGAHTWLDTLREQPDMMNMPELRNASHEALSRDVVENNPLGKLFLSGVVPGYSAAKAFAQNFGGGAYGPWIDKALAMGGFRPLYNASAPSWDEVMAGLRPVFGK